MDVPHLVSFIYVWNMNYPQTALAEEGKMKKIILFLVLFLFSSCATGLSTRQKHELKTYQARGMVVEEKSVGEAVGLGFFFGGGSFYTRHYGLGVCNLLFWPLSIFWDPISGANGAESINYYATIEEAKRLQKKEIRQLDRDLEDKKIDQKDYLTKKREVEEKYTVD